MQRQNALKDHWQMKTRIWIKIGRKIGLSGYKVTLMTWALLINKKEANLMIYR